MINETYIDYVAWCGVLLGLLNLALNVINTAISVWYSKEHVKLTIKVRRPYLVYGLRKTKPDLILSIVNLSTFNVYIRAVGFCPSLRCNKYEEMPRIVFKEVSPELRSHEGVSLTVSSDVYGEQIRTSKYMYVETESGYIKVSRVE